MSRERLLELLADEALGTLDPSDGPELARLQTLHPDISRDALLDVVCAVEETGPPLRRPPDAMPAALRAKLEADARRFFAAPAQPAPPAVRRRASLSTLGWFAAAAGWTLVVLSWLSAREVPRAPVPAAATLEAVAAAGDALVLPFAAGGDATGAGASGDVVWSNGRQEGFLRFRGLARNDPRVSQYQLWIFDAKRNEAHPVDGGVFDVASDGEVVVPIRAKLPVFEPTLFAVTVEAPGGVVVSSRERIALLAKPKG